jgi:hypothetical protein
MADEDRTLIKPPLGKVPRRVRVGKYSFEARLAGIAALCAAGAVLLVVALGGAVRGCRASGRLDDLEQRVLHVETALGMSDAGMIVSLDTPSGQTDAGTGTIDSSAGECAIAKVAAYRAWQEAFARAKALAAPALASCGGTWWSDEKKQNCYHNASAGFRAAQAARDSVIAGGSTARDAVKSVKDDAKNEAIAPARAASERALAACGEVPDAE